MKRRVAHLPLHSGKAPPWLVKGMTKLAGTVTMAIVEEFGPAEMLRRLSDPWSFQAFGCVLGFDWHSSGVTTVTCGALKEAAKVCGPDLGILVAGGKGGTSRKSVPLCDPRFPPHLCRWKFFAARPHGLIQALVQRRGPTHWRLFHLRIFSGALRASLRYIDTSRLVTS